MTYLGLCSVTFREKTVDEILQIVIDNGLNYIEWGADKHLIPGDFDEAKRIKNLCEDNDIKFSYGGYYKYRETDDDIDLVLKTAKELGTKDVRIWAKRISSKDIGAQEYEEFIKETREIADKAAKLDLRINFEHHRQTLTDTTDSAMKMIEDIGKENVFMYWQPQAFESEIQKLEGIDILKDKITNVHVFNWDDEFNRYPLKDSYNNWKSYIEHLGGDRAYLLEFVKDDSIEQFKEDAKTLKEIIGGIYGS